METVGANATDSSCCGDPLVEPHASICSDLKDPQGPSDLNDECAAHNSHAKNGHSYLGISAHGSSRLHAGNVYNTHYHVTSATPGSTSYAADDNDAMRQLLHCLAFEHMNSRSATIATAHPKTCRWLVDCAVYKRWRDPDLQARHHGCLWVKGKPGAGKSTIMKSLASYANDTYKGETVIAYYFNARGVTLEKSVEGMFRYILHQMVANVPTILRRVSTIDMMAYKERGWPLEILKDLFRETVQLLAGVSEINLFIDALDENDSEDDVRDMIMFVEETTEQAFAEGRAIHICLASRHYPVITVEHSEELVLDTHYNHRSDIDAYVQSQLRLKDPSLKATLASSIIDRASGVFLWVVLVVRVLNKEADHGRRHHLEEKLLEIPDRLSDFFDDILGKNEGDRHLVTVVLWMLYAKERMQPAQLYHSIMLSVGQLSATDAALAPQTFDEAAIIEYVLSMSKGLLEYTKYPVDIGDREGGFQFIHESVREYFLAQGLQKIDTTLSGDLQAIGHARLAKWCQTYLVFARESGFLDEPKQEQSVRRCPLLIYALEFVLSHAEEAARRGLRNAISNEVPFDIWLLLSRYHGHSPSTMLQVLAWANCVELVNVELERHANRPLEERQRYLNSLPPKDLSYPKSCAALHIATWSCNVDIVYALINSGADVNLYCESHGNPLHATADPRARSLEALLKDLNTGMRWSRLLREFDTTRWYSGHERVVRLLLDQGAEVNAPDPESATTLGSAIRSNLVWLAQLLIDTGASVDVPDVARALAIAVGKSNIEIVRLLLESGANVNVQDVDLRTIDKAAVKPKGMDLEKTLFNLLDVDVNKASVAVATFLNIPVRHGDIEMAELLIGFGADVNMLCAGATTTLEIAVRQLDSRMLKLLLSSGADPNTSALGCRGLLSIAVENRDSTTFDILREHDLDDINPIGIYDTAMLAVDRAWQILLASHTISLLLELVLINGVKIFILGTVVYTWLDMYHIEATRDQLR
jgi:ankyrin repeat protein